MPHCKLLLVSKYVKSVALPILLAESRRMGRAGRDGAVLVAVSSRKVIQFAFEARTCRLVVGAAAVTSAKPTALAHDTAGMRRTLALRRIYK